MNLQSTLDFLRDLAENNNKAWFEEHRASYQKARSAFEDLTAEVIGRFDDVDDLYGVRPQDCMFRINRDIRFSKDKSPYKVQMGALIAPGGRKPTGRSYYVQVQPGGSMIAGGLYDPDSKTVEKVRQQILADARPLRKLLAAPDFVKYFGTMQGETLKTAPAGYDKTHPAIDLLRYKQFVAIHDLTDEVACAPDFVGHVIQVCKALKPFVGYFYSITG
ncbi:MAG TPA: DUF2461 domain-containing protein [Aggregatilineales bacterium]|nr:DUF2461 domain-containing protein [Aggregatilineales bacterium]